MTEPPSEHMFSTLFPAQSVERQLNTREGIDSAIAWCRQTAVTKVYVESFRDGLLASRDNLVRARDRFRDAGLEVSGCVTTTLLAKSSEVGWEMFPCFTNAGSQRQLEEIFTFTAPLFDEIMIDDFYCTACECAECRAARGGHTWAEYRLDLMRRLSRERVLDPVHRINPRATVIIKYPQWYESFHERGYDPDAETAMFDRTWVGTETRDMEDERWGGCATYRAFWIMRWLGQIGGAKCGGGWYDPYGTHEDSYLEQARQTILGGARESVLFCYPSLLEHTGPANVEALRAEQPALLELAAWVHGVAPRGVASYKPIGSDPEGEEYIFDWLGMIGIPLVPAHQFPLTDRVAFLPAHAAHDPAFASDAAALLARGSTVLLTSRAAAHARLGPDRPGVTIVAVPSSPQQIPALPPQEIASLRLAALAPLGLTLDGPPNVALYLFGEDKIALESFRAEPAEMQLTLREARSYRLALALGHRGAGLSASTGTLTVTLPPRTLVCLEV